MTFHPELADESINSVRNQRRKQQDKKRMAYRKAIEDYREAQALNSQLRDFPELMGSPAVTLPRPGL